jgi:DNA-binding CsgD family transcriptional regulator
VTVTQNKLIPSRITPTEAEILRYVSQGRSNAEIALVRGTARATVKNQISTLLAKFGAKSRLHLALGYRDMLDDSEPTKGKRIR